MMMRKLSPPILARVDEQLRTQKMYHWVTGHLHRYELIIESLRYIAGEASCRKYYRINGANPFPSLIIMDSPPWLENNPSFVAVADLLASASICVPSIYEWNEAQGFLLLEDMGEETLLEINLHNDCDTVLIYYFRSINTLLKIQIDARSDSLPEFSHALMHQELELFTHWYLNQHLGIDLQEGLQHDVAACFDLIINKNQAIPKVFVHRDFRPGNLIASADKIAVLDFQDAIRGPITYDLVSLMWDSFHCWDDEFIAKMVFHYWSTAVTRGLPVPPTFSEFEDQIYWTSLQRHLRVIGIFARLGIREGKTRYLNEIQRFTGYLISLKSPDKRMQPIINLLIKSRAEASK